MPKKDTTHTQTALEPANDNAHPPAAGSSTALATADAGDELAGLDLGGADDGLGEIDSTDIRVATLTLNAKRTDERGKQIGADMLFNTIDETARESVEAAFLLLHKTNAYQRFNQSENKNENVCTSRDRVTGVYHEQNNRERPCEGCPDAEWTTDADGKRKRNCSVVYNVFSVDRSNQQLFVIKFKRTSLDAFKAHMQKHHIGRRIVKGARVNYPLYAFGVRLSGKMAGTTGTTYAVPVIERLAALPAEEIRMCAESVDAIKAQLGSVLDKVEAQEATIAVSDADDSRGGDASFNTDQYSGAAGQDFVTSANGDGQA